MADVTVRIKSAIPNNYTIIYESAISV